MNTLFNNNDGRKRSTYDRNIHMAKTIIVDIYQTNKKLFVTVHQNKTCKFELTDHLWLPFIDQPES